MLLNITNLNSALLKKSEIDQKLLLLLKQMGALIPKSEGDRDILKSQNKLLYKHDIYNHIKIVQEKCSKTLDYNGVQNLYLVTLNPKYEFALNKLQGVLGYSLRNNTYILIYLSEHNKINNNISSLFTHEYHHVLRNLILQKKRIGKSKILLDYIIEEGLAENFVSKVLGQELLNPWAKSSTLKEIKDNGNILLSNLNEDRPKSIYSILYGDKELGIPLWIGYSFGFYFINYLHMNNRMDFKFLTEQNIGYFQPYIKNFFQWI